MNQRRTETCTASMATCANLAADRAWLRTPVPMLDFDSRGRPARSPPPPRGLRLLRRVSSSRILLSLALIARRAAMVELRSVTVTAWFPPRYFWATFVSLDEKHGDRDLSVCLQYWKGFAGNSTVCSGVGGRGCRLFRYTAAPRRYRRCITREWRACAIQQATKCAAV